MDEIFVGIDLGTTNTLACYLKRGRPELIRFPGSGKMIPSVLYVDGDGILVGKKAKRKGVLNPLNVIRSAKTYMANPKKKWKLAGHEFTPTDVATEVLKEVKTQILKKFSCPPETKVSAVITVPAYFTGNQKDETRKAGIAAGFNVLQIITEPMAAAVAAVRELNLDEKIFVVDLGGGTFDISVLEAIPSEHTYRALDTDGDRKLGGDQFDDALYDYFIGLIQEDLGLDLSSQEVSGLDFNEYYSMTGRVRDAAEQAKIDLSNEKQVAIDLLNLFTYGGKNYDFSCELTREEFNDICQPLYDKITARIKKFIDVSDKFKLEEISTIILAGGSCYIPKVREDVEKIFGKRADSQLDLDTLVVVGACFVAESINGTVTETIQDILSHSLGVEVQSPTNKKKMILSKILNKGSEYPCEFTKVYTTTRDNQTTVPIFIYEAGADAEDIEDIEAHEYYGDVSLENIAPAPARVPKISVTFNYDLSGTLFVTAQDENSGVKNFIEIKKGDQPVRKNYQQPIDFILLLDTSGSMGGYAIDEAKRACEILLTNMIDLSTHRLGLITFDSHATRLSSLTNDKTKLINLVRGVGTGGATELLEALQLADSDFRASTNSKVVIIVTDGNPYPRPESEALNFAAKMKRSNIRIVTIGTGTVNKNFIEAVSSPGDAYKIDNMSKLKETFEIVLDTIFET